jgi:DnaJ family protein A protein 2
MPEQVSALSQVLPGADANGSAAAAMDEDAEECHMSAVANIKEECNHRHRMSRQQSSNAYDSDDDEDMPRGGQRVQCAQQ